MTLQISGQGSWAAGSVWLHFNMSTEWAYVDYQFNNRDMKYYETLIRVIPPTI